MTRTNSILSLLVVTSLTCVSLMSVPAALADEETSELTLTINNINEQEGKLMIALFDNEADFKSNVFLIGDAPIVDASEITTVYDGLEPGEYGIKVYHDVNDDNELNVNLMGIPQEPFGFSNGATANFGPARWTQAKFTVSPGENSHTISLQ